MGLKSKKGRLREGIGFRVTKTEEVQDYRRNQNCINRHIQEVEQWVCDTGRRRRNLHNQVHVR